MHSLDLNTLSVLDWDSSVCLELQNIPTAKQDVLDCVQNNFVNMAAYEVCFLITSNHCLVVFRVGISVLRCMYTSRNKLLLTFIYLDLINFTATKLHLLFIRVLIECPECLWFTSIVLLPISPFYYQS